MTNRWLIAVGAALAALALSSSAEACRAVRSLTPAEVSERTLLFVAQVESLDRAPDGDGLRIRATLRPVRAVHGELPSEVVAEDYLPADDPTEEADEIIIYCGGRYWIGDELARLSVGDEVAVLAWRQESGFVNVNDMARVGGERARRLLNAPRP